jgi:hypothetical protein
MNGAEDEYEAEDKIIRADPAYRMQAVALLAVLIAVGVTALLATDRYLGGLRDLAHDSPEAAAAKAATLFRVLMAGTALIPLLAGAWLSRLAWRGWVEGEFPPPGTRVIMDTAVVSGRNARRLASLTFALGVILVLTAVTLAAFGWWMARTLPVPHGG